MVFSGRPEHLAHSEKRHDVTLLPHSHHQAVDDGERQRQLQQKGGAAPSRRADLDAAAQFLDVPAHHIHSDTAPGNVGYLRRGAEAGLEDQVVDFVVATDRLPKRSGPSARPFRRIFVTVQAAAVVGDFDDHLAGLVVRLQEQSRRRGSCRLPAVPPAFRCRGPGRCVPCASADRPVPRRWSGRVRSRRPAVSISTCLPNWRERSRTRRAMRRNNGPMGTSRIAMAVFCNSAVMRVSCAMLRCSRWLLTAANSGSWRTSDSAITISPAMSTR